MDRPLTVANPEGLHARPAAVFVETASRFRARIRVRKDGDEADGTSVLELLGLDVRQGDRITIRADGEDAAQALDALATVVAFRESRTFRGVPASSGIGVARAWVHRVAELRLPVGPVDDVEADLTALKAALAAVRGGLRSAAGRTSGDAAEILAAQAAIADDPALARTAEAVVRAGTPAVRAILDTGTTYARRIERADDPYLAARGADVREVCDRVARELLGMPTPDLRGPQEPSIVIAHDLTPSDTAALDPRRIRGLVTETGSSTSHTSILARSLEVPAVVAVRGVLDAVSTGTVVAVDGGSGMVYVEPDEPTRRALRTREEERRQRRRALRAGLGEEPATTKDGHRVEIAANVRSVDEVQVALQAGAEGVGLFRTELLFLDRRWPPTEDEHADVLTAMCRLLGDRRLVVRTLDVGADKPVAFLPTREERNPELGVRGIRLAMRHPELLDAQLRAVVRAARAGGHIAVMAPMVATVEEAEWFVGRVRRLGGSDAGVAVGVMVEVPAAILLASELAGRVDFLSIGTNDLTQYLLAADRRDGELAELQDSFSPAVLRAVRMTCEAAAPHGVWVGVCGEAAADPGWAVLAVGLGVTELSMQAASILDVRAALAERTLDECRSAASAACEVRGGAR